jgi:hypothetical protein
LRQYGRPLCAFECEILSPYFKKETLDKARIIQEHVPFWLNKRMCAVVLGHTIYMRKGAYSKALQPSLTDLALLAHELTHVEQYLSGMTIAKYLWASRHGYRQNPYEVEAYAKEALIAAEIGSKHCNTA